MLFRSFLLVPFLALVGLGIAGAFQGSDWSWRFLGIPGFFGAAFLLLAQYENYAPRLLRAVCKWLGETTYGAYLWHVPLQLVILLVLLPGPELHRLTASPWFLVAYLGAVIAIARISYVHFERPVRDWLRRRLQARGRAGAVGAP